MKSYRKSLHVRRDIPSADFPKAFKDGGLVEELLSDQLLRMKRGEKWKPVDLRKLPKRLAFGLVFLDWIGDLSEIVENMNIVITDLHRLRRRRHLRAQELWARYRLLARTFFYEFYRIKEVLGRFLKQLKILGAIDEQDRKKTTKEIISVLLKPMIDARNKITHDTMCILEEEKEAYIVTAAAAARSHVVDTRTGRIIQPHEPIGGAASSLASEFTQIAKFRVDFLQRFTEEIATELVNDAFLEKMPKTSDAS